jgi:hypothetical protein
MKLAYVVTCVHVGVPNIVETNARYIYELIKQLYFIAMHRSAVVLYNHF